MLPQPSRDQARSGWGTQDFGAGLGEDKCNSGSLRDDKQKGGNGARGWLELDAVLADDGEDGQEIGEGEEFLDSFAEVDEL